MLVLLLTAGCATTPNALLESDAVVATSVKLSGPSGLAIDDAGNLYIADTKNHRILKVTTGGMISTVAGTGRRSAWDWRQGGFSGDGGPAISGELNQPSGLAVDGAGNLYIADSGNNRIRKVTPTGMISTIAGTGKGGFSGDRGPATSAKLNKPFGVAIDSAGSLYIADTYNLRIRKVSPIGVISTVAGIGKGGFNGDGGQATSAKLTPFAVAVDGAGNLYVADFFNCLVRKVNPAGVINTVAGNGTYGFSGDGGPATLAQLSNPTGVSVDKLGNVYIMDQNNHWIRKVNPEGRISSVVYRNETPIGQWADPLLIAWTSGITMDGEGNLYFTSDAGNSIQNLSRPQGGIATGGTSGLVISTVHNIAAGIWYGRIGMDNRSVKFISYNNNLWIEKMTPTGAISTMAGLVQSKVN